MRLAFRVDIQGALRGMSEARLKTMFAVEQYGRAAAAKLEQVAKDEAPWHDRTGLARQTMAGVADWVGETFRVGIAGNMNYSPYLELLRDGQYAILWPTINKMTPEILRGMSGLLK
jgi:hypothetical protein